MRRIVALCLLLFAASAAAASKSFEALDDYLGALAKHDRMMLGLAIGQEDEISYQGQAGLAVIDGHVPIGPETRFRIGSITKTFTSVIVMQLVEESALSLDATLDGWYPAVENAERITLRQMMRHRSGIRSFTDDPAYPSFMSRPVTAAELEQRIGSYEAVFAPGERYEYSNSNYWLLGRIVERVTGRDYGTALAERIAGPLGLGHTRYGDALDEPDEARSYRWTSGGWRLAEETDMSVPGGAGAMVSTSADLLRFLRGLFEGELVSADSLAAMTDIEDGYGLGLIAFPYYEKRFYGHNGGIDGFQSTAAYNPDDGTAIAALANAVNGDFNGVLVAALDAAYGRPVKIPDFSAKPVELDPASLELLIGSYTSDDLPLELRLFMDGGQLMAQATDQPAFPVTPFSETEFRFEPAGIVIRFDAGSLEADAKPAFTLEQGGGSFAFMRKP
ncbi:MAG: serine hydrolase [Gammaproteobacteria bacterium]